MYIDSSTFSQKDEKKKKKDKPLRKLNSKLLYI